MFGRTSRHEMLVFLIFVLVSISFWVAQTAYEERPAEYNVALVIEGQPQDIVFTTHLPQELKVTIKDKNHQHVNYSYSHHVQQLTVNFERYADAMGNFRISGAELQSLLRAELVGTSQITAVSPSLIDARFAVTEGRRFPVRVNGTFLTAPNYRQHPIKVVPDSVTINAPSAVLDTLRYVSTTQLRYENIRDTLHQELYLELPLGVKATPAKVDLLVPVSQYVERVFDHLPIQVTDLHGHQRLTLFPFQAKVTCLIDFEYYKTLRDEDFLLTVSYDSLTSDEQKLLPVNLQYLGPADVATAFTVTPCAVEFIIED